MFPGRINPKKMKQMMKQMGMNMEAIEGVQKIIIVTDKGNYVFDSADVVAMTMQGITTYQISGEPHFEAAEVEIPEEDVNLVKMQTGAAEETVRATLRETKGDIAEAILRLSQA
ncbi:MAG: nascent polypeptide-associated complex protein [Methanomicrobiales archaeon]|nr:nascent polypeptide-associated complex protein [Methanomicrobiales archaeon]MDI6877050.1 nascent polypeptide-associated complex protein [Methanomicrobiales archaeon]